MNTTIRLIKNTFYLTIADFFSPFVNVILVIYISRTLGSDGLGAYTAIVAFLFLIEKFAQMGLHQIIIRDIARNQKNANQYFVDALVIGFLSSIVSYLVLHVLLAFIQYPPDITASIKVLGISIFFFVMKEYFFAFYEGFQRMEYKSIVSLFLTFLRTGSGILVVYLGMGVAELIWALVITRILVCFISFIYALKLGLRFTEKPDKKRIFKLLRQTMTFLMISVITTTYWKIDILMLTKMKNITDVGYYSAAYRLLDILKGLMTCYISALYPMLAISFGTAQNAFNRQLSLSIKYLFMVTFPMALGTTILSGPIIYLIYGNSFGPAVLTLQVLIWTICFFPIAIILARALVASNNQRFDLFGNIIALCINLVLNYFLIRQLSELGAALATSISILVFLFIQYFFVYNHVVKLPFLKYLLRPTLASIVMGIAVYFAKGWPLGFSILTGIVVYIAALFLLRVFTDDEMQLLKRLWREKGMLLKPSQG